MKKILIILVVVLNLVACTAPENIEIVESSPVLGEFDEIDGTTLESLYDDDFVNQLYNDFLLGKISAGNMSIDELTIPTGEPDERYRTSYALFDSNGDGVPELHLNASRYYYVFTIKNGDIVTWKNLSPYPHYLPLNNGAFMSVKYGAGPRHDIYNYYVFDYSGNTIYSLNFSKYDTNGNGSYEDEDEYFFDWVSVTKEQWELLTEKFLYTSEDGIEYISNQIEWTVLFE